jgi:hypothetical protein
MYKELTHPNTCAKFERELSQKKGEYFPHHGAAAHWIVR